MTTPQTAQALADEALNLLDRYDQAQANLAQAMNDGINVHGAMSRVVGLREELEHTIAALATQAEAPACPDPAGCLREGCNQNGDGSLCERYVEAEAPAAPAQADTVSRCNAVMGLMDDYIDHPSNANRHAIRSALLALAAPPAQPAPVVQPLTDVMVEIAAEVERATAKFPTWPTDPLHALAVLGEEFGELTKDVLQLAYEPHKTNAENVRKEAMQTAAMSLRFAASLTRYEYVQCQQHSQGALGIGTQQQQESGK